MENVAMKTKIGYFIPEFPGQTHIFFWREMKKLRELNIEPEVVSTRRPADSIISHSWAEEAIANTDYLFPPTGPGLISAAITVLGCGPIAWTRCLTAIFGANDLSLKQRLRMFGMVLMGAKLVQLAREKGWKHIHVHSCADAANVAMFAQLLAAVPYSMTLHGPISDYGPNQAAKWRNSEFTIVITNKLYREAQTELKGNLPASVPIAPMGVDLDCFQRTQAYVPWTSNGPLRVFACGRINVCKGHEYLIEAISLLQQRGIDARLEIAGAVDSANTSYHEKLVKLIRARDLKSAVTLLGAVSEDVVRDRLESAHLFALASLHEPLGVVYMEAMALQLPVVTTNAGGVTELITDGTEGYLVPPKSAEQLADAIERLVAQPSTAEEMGQAGRARVEESYHSGISAEAIARNILKEDFPVQPSSLSKEEDLHLV